MWFKLVRAASYERSLEFTDAASRSSRCSAPCSWSQWSLGSLAFIGTEFMPRLDEGSILIETRKLPGISLPESVQIEQAGRESVLELSRSSRRRHQDWPSRSGHRGHGHLSKATFMCCLSRMSQWTTGQHEGELDRGSGGGRWRRCRAWPTTSRSRWRCGSTRWSRESRRMSR